jgi:hypothetical protein
VVSAEAAVRQRLGEQDAFAESVSKALLQDVERWRSHAAVVEKGRACGQS